jgi:hypothetical protein
MKFPCLAAMAFGIALLTACANDGYDPESSSSRGPENPGRQRKPGENKFAPAQPSGHAGSPAGN